MKTYISLLVAVFGIACCQPPQNITKPTDSNDQLIIGHVDSVYSEILGESRTIWVHVPGDASGGLFDQGEYPVLYLLDGPGHFYSVTGMIKQLSTTNGNMVVPEMVVVAISNTDRGRDLTPTPSIIDPISGDSIRYANGGGAAFLEFIEKELMPHIEKNYPVIPYNTFVGHSFGGLSVIDALVSKPHLFDNYVSIDPSLWWDDQNFMKSALSKLEANDYAGKSLYIGVANTMPKEMSVDKVRNDTSRTTYHIRSILDFVNSVDAQSENGLQFKWKYYNDDSHGSVPLIAEYDAFRFLFPWYAFDDFRQIANADSSATAESMMEIVNSHYDLVSKKFGYSIPPPAHLVNILGYQMLNQGKFDLAHAFFDLNIQNYPTTSNVYDSKGDAYLAEKDSLEALNYFIKALEVGPNNYSQEKIDAINGALNK